MSLVTVAGKRGRSLVGFFPHAGVWRVEIELDEAATLAGSVEILIGATSLRGVVDPSRSGTFAEGGSVVVIGGAGGWSKTVPRRHFHNDARVSPSGVAKATALEAGETLEIPAALDAREVDMVRPFGLASAVLELLYPSVPWWVDLAGVTHVGERPIVDVTGKVELLDVVTGARIAELSADDVSLMMPGAQLTDTRLGEAPFVVHDLELSISGAKVRGAAWAGGGRDARIVDVWRRLLVALDPGRIYARGPFRYRVVDVAGERLRLQVVNAKLGLPDVLYVGIAPGLSGASAEVAAGAIVLLEFIEADSQLPIVTHFARKDSEGFLPVSVAIDAQGDVNLADALGRVVREGDTISITPGNGAGDVTGLVAVTIGIGAPPVKSRVMA